MPVFVYEARDAAGMLKRDTIEAANVREATQRLQQQHMTVINIRERVATVASIDVGSWLTNLFKKR